MARINVCDGQHEDGTACKNNERTVSLLNVSKEVAIELFDNNFLTKFSWGMRDIAERDFHDIVFCKTCFIRANKVIKNLTIVSNKYDIITFEKNDYTEIFEEFKNAKLEKIYNNECFGRDRF